MSPLTPYHVIDISFRPWSVPLLKGISVQTGDKTLQSPRPRLLPGLTAVLTDWNCIHHMATISVNNWKPVSLLGYYEHVAKPSIGYEFLLWNLKHFK